jgi:hypothetical protein
MPPTFETGEPASAEALSHTLGALHAAGAAYLSTLPDGAFFGPQGTAWSPADHVRHLEKSTAPLVLALKLPRWLLTLRFGTTARPSRSFTGVRDAYRQLLAGGAQAGRYAPDPEGTPADPPARRREIMHGWTAAVVGLQNATTRWSEPALDRHLLPHPLMGLLTVREMLAFTVYHTAHHLRRVAERAAA